MSEAHHIFGSDRPLLYDVEPWSRLGFAVPNCGDNVGTLSLPIHHLADQVGKAQLFIMTHIDAQRTQPPSPNTLDRVCKVCNRVKAVLAGRQKTYADLRIEEGHASSDLRPWSIHPVPYFASAIVRNPWLAEYNRLTMIALTNVYQHSDNNLALTVTEKFATDIWQYFREVVILVGTELLGLPGETVVDPDFVFPAHPHEQYNPEPYILNFETLDTPGPVQSRATEDDIRPLFEGLPANLLAEQGVLKQYPVGEGMLGWSGSPLPAAASAPGTADGSGIGPAGRTIGEPMI